MDLNSKTAIVTGASRGLGKATAIALLQKGATVFGIARSETELEALAAEWGGQFNPVILDLTREEKVQSWASEAFSVGTPPDILINNAGAGYFESIEAFTSDQWHQMVDTNLNAVFYLTAAVVPYMKAVDSSSHIINIGSILGKVSSSGKSAYSATKFAIQGFSEALFKELRGDNIKVSCVNPGSIETGFFEASGIEPNPRMLQPKELAELLVYLLETPENMLIDELTVRPLRSS